MTRSPREVPADFHRHGGDAPGPGGSPRFAFGGLRDVRADQWARWLKALAWAAFPGMFIGAFIGVAEGAMTGFFVMVVITLGAGGAAILLSEAVGAMVRGATNPAGRPGPGRHSGADALVVRGDPEAAIAVLRASLEEFPDDAEAMMKIAHILRNDVGDARRAITAFRRARMSGALSEGRMRLAMREMLELARSLDQSHMVVADLKEHQKLFEGTAEDVWASRELVRITRPGDASPS